MRLPKTVFAGHERVLRQTVIAMANGQALEEHDSPGEATLHVLHGRVRLVAGPDAWDGLPGDLLVMPERRHRVEAVQDCAFLFTTAR